MLPLPPPPSSLSAPPHCALWLHVLCKVTVSIFVFHCRVTIYHQLSGFSENCLLAGNSPRMGAWAWCGWALCSGHHEADIRWRPADSHPDPLQSPLRLLTEFSFYGCRMEVSFPSLAGSQRPFSALWGLQHSWPRPPLPPLSQQWRISLVLNPSPAPKLWLPLAPRLRFKGLIWLGLAIRQLPFLKVICAI